MRQSIAAVSLIYRKHKGRMLWLARWNTKWQCYYFISGHKRPDETFRECIVREVSEELHMRECVDFVVADEPIAHVEYTAWSESVQEETSYIMELFEVKLNGRSVRQTVDVDPQNRWLSKAEICSQRCTDEKPVSPTMDLLLSKVKRNCWNYSEAEVMKERQHAKTP